MKNFIFLSYTRIVMNLLGFYFDFNKKLFKKNNCGKLPETHRPS
jgi:hypothetical protein